MKLALLILIVFFSFFQVQSNLCVLDCDWSQTMSSIEDQQQAPCHQNKSDKTQKQSDKNHCFDMDVCNSGQIISKQKSYELKSQILNSYKKNFVENFAELKILIAQQQPQPVFKTIPHWSLQIKTLKHTIKTHTFLI